MQDSIEVDLLAAHLLPFARERAHGPTPTSPRCRAPIRRPRWSASSGRQPLPGVRTAGRTRPSSPTWSTRSARSTTTEVRGPCSGAAAVIGEPSAVAAGGSSAAVARSASVATSSARARSEALRFQRRFSGERVSAMNTSPTGMPGVRAVAWPARAPLRGSAARGSALSMRRRAAGCPRHARGRRACRCRRSDVRLPAPRAAGPAAG